MSHRRFARPMWHLVDAKDQLVGRIATQIAPILRGKHKPTFSPNYDCGDYVVIINAQDCKFSGSKDKQKTYSWHTGFPGGVKHTNPAALRADKPEEVTTILLFSLLVECDLSISMFLKV
jgi:large subunit ribosomal protein L13